MDLVKSFLTSPSKVGGVFLVAYFLPVAIQYVSTFLKAMQMAQKSIGSGGLFSSDFGLFVLTLPWSLVFEMNLPRSFWPENRSYGYRVSDFLNDQSIAINYFLYFVFMVLNAGVLYFVGFYLSKAFVKFLD